MKYSNDCSIVGSYDNIHTCTVHVYNYAYMNLYNIPGCSLFDTQQLFLVLLRSKWLLHSQLQKVSGITEWYDAHINSHFLSPPVYTIPYSGSVFVQYLYLLSKVAVGNIYHNCIRIGSYALVSLIIVSIQTWCHNRFNVSTDPLEICPLFIILSTRLPSLGVVYIRSSADHVYSCLLYTSPSPRDATLSRMPSSA